MLWPKYLAITILFLLVWLLQTSFLPHFSLMGAVPDLLFVFFFLFVFFENKNKFSQMLFISVVAGILFDVSNSTFFGFSTILLFLIGFCDKKALFFLKDRQDSRPLIYFAPMFLISLILFGLAFNVYFDIFKVGGQAQNFNTALIARILYNLGSAVVGYFVFKNIITITEDDRQLSLFTN